ncbi:hypothetical protein D3C81_09470 [compost metagenome]
MDLKNASIEELSAELYRKRVAKGTTKARYEIIGIWSGYEDRQRKIAYREYTTNKQLVADIRKLNCVIYTDGTRLELSVREMQYRERKQTIILGYKTLVKECIKYGVNSVAQIQRIKEKETCEEIVRRG